MWNTNWEELLFSVKKKRWKTKIDSLVQGDPNQDFRFQMAVTLKLSPSDAMLVKPKCVREAVGFFFLKNCKQTAEKHTHFFEN